MEKILPNQLKDKEPWWYVCVCNTVSVSVLWTFGLTANVA